MHVLERVQCGFHLPHRDAVRDPYLVARVFSAPAYVESVGRGERVSQNHQLGLALRSGSAHLLGILELGDDRSANSQPDFADDFRWQSRHQNPDLAGHPLPSAHPLVSLASARTAFHSAAPTFWTDNLLPFWRSGIPSSSGLLLISLRGIGRGSRSIACISTIDHGDSPPLLFGS